MFFKNRIRSRPRDQRRGLRFARSLRVETLEVRRLLAAELTFNGSNMGAPDDTVSTHVQILGLPPRAEGESPPFWDGFVSSDLVSRDFPLNQITHTEVVDGLVYTIGNGLTGSAAVYEWDPATGTGVVIDLQNLSSLNGAGLGQGFAYNIAKVGEDIFFVGQSTSIDFGVGGATIWDYNGNPSTPALLSDLNSQGGVLWTMGSEGSIVGQQGLYGVYWSPEGVPNLLPRGELAEALDFSSSPIAMNADHIVGRIDAMAATWIIGTDEAPTLKEYGFDDLFAFAFQNGEGGSVPDVGQFILETDLFGTIMFSNYFTSQGIRSGAWSVETGAFLFGYDGEIMDVLKDATGEIIVATNDVDFSGSGALWTLDGEVLYLTDLLGEDGPQKPFFTAGGLFETETGFGIVGRGEVAGESTNFVSLLDRTGDTTDPVIPDLPADLLLGIASGRPNESIMLSAEVRIGNGEPFAGETPVITDLLGNYDLLSQVPLQVADGRDSKMLGDILYTAGRTSDGQPIARELDLSTGDARLIQLRHLMPLADSSGLAYAVALVGDEIVFGGHADLGEAFVATTWDLDGNPTRASFIPELASIQGFIRDIASDGSMTGIQSSVAVVWNSAGDVFQLKRTEISDALGERSSGIAIDGRTIVGSIGTNGVAWEAIGDPMDGNYALKEYGYDDLFTYVMQNAPGGSAPESGQFVLNSEVFGTIMFAAYQTPEGVRNGAWNIDDGSFIRDFGFGHVQGVLEEDGNIFVISNDPVAKSGVLWSFTDPEPMYLTDVLVGEGFDVPYFSRGGLFGYERDEGKGLGFLAEAKARGESVQMIGRFPFREEVVEEPWFRFVVDKIGNGVPDFVHEGTAKSIELVLSYPESGSYNVVVQAFMNGGEEPIAVGTTTIDIAPFAPGTERIDFAPMDISGNGTVAPLDALLVINQIARVNRGEEIDLRFDVNGDGVVTPMDALVILNQLRIGGMGQAVPLIGLQNDSGVQGDGLTNDLSLTGTAPATADLFISFGEEVRDISHTLGVDGVFSLPQDQMEELFGPFADGDYEFRVWSGTIDARAELKSRVSVAYDATPPADFAVHSPVLREDGTRRLRWDVAIGASRYQVFIKSGGDADFSPLGDERRTEFLALEGLVSGSHEAYVLAWDAAGNATESSPIQFAI